MTGHDPGGVSTGVVVIFDCGLCPAEIHGTAADALAHAVTEHPGPSWAVEDTADGPLIVATYSSFADQLAA